MTPTPERRDTVVELEFRFHDGTYPFVAGSAAEDCTFELAKMIPRPGGRFAEFFSVTDADPARIEALAGAHDDVTVTLLTEYDNGGLFEFHVAGSCPAYRLGQLGALPQEVSASDGEGRILADVPPRHDAGTITDAFLHATPEAELTRKREKEDITPAFTITGFQHVLQEHLTDRQVEAVTTAFEGGYYAWPRECSAEEIAERLDISTATFSEHIRAAERKLLRLLLNRPEVSGSLDGSVDRHP
jgi:predicted DNA binding protein